MEVTSCITASFVGHVTAMVVLSQALPALDFAGTATDDQHMRAHATLVVDGGSERVPRSYGVRALCVTCGFGAMGDPDAPEGPGRYGVAGPADNPDPHVAFVPNASAAEFPLMAGVVPSGGGAPDAPLSATGRNDSLGTDPLDARGMANGAAIGPSKGPGGHGMIVIEGSLGRGYRCRMP